MSKVITDIATVIDSLHSTPEYSEAGFPMVRVVDVNNEFIKLDKCLKVDEVTFNKHNKNHIPQKGDIIITRVGSFGMLGYVETDEKFCLGQNIAIIHPYSKSKYLYYYLSSPFLKKKLYSKIGGSAYKCIGLDDIRRLPYYDSGLDTENIGNILFNLDYKIVLNNRINAELEAMAKTVYDYWFVQFDFPFDFAQGKPSAAGKPYKSSGGKMVWSEELKREVPEGWEVGELKDIANITMGQSPAGESYNEDGNGMVFYQGCTDFGTRYPSVRKYTTEPTRFAKQGDILLSVRAPVGTLNIAKEDCCIGRGLAALNSKDNCIAYLFGVMVNLKQVFDRRNTDGTTFGSITKDDLFTLKVIKPSDEVLEMYHKLINPGFEKQNLVAEENQQLSSLRDWLLPMLMNGQVKVGEQPLAPKGEEEMEVERLMAAEGREKYGKIQIRK